MSELGHGWTARGLAAAAIAIGVACGGDGSSPPTTTAPPPSTIAPAPPSTAPAAPPTTQPQAAAPAGPRAVPTVEFKEGGDLVAFSNTRWKDDTQRQVAVDVKLLKGPIASLWFAFQAGDRQIASGVLPGNAFSDTQATTAVLPPATGVGPKGKEQLMDITTADRLVIHVFGLPAGDVPAGQPAWVAPLVTSCEQGSAADCQTLAIAYRTGSSDQGAVTPDPALAQRFSKRFVAMGERSCAMGGPEACFVLGRAYLAGEDVPANRDRGIALVQKACAAGFDPACQWQVANPGAIQKQPH